MRLAERSKHLKIGEAKYFITVKEYVKKHKISSAKYLYRLIKEDRVIHQRFANQIMVDKRYPPLLYDRK